MNKKIKKLSLKKLQILPYYATVNQKKNYQDNRRRLYKLFIFPDKLKNNGTQKKR